MKTQPDTTDHYGPISVTRIGHAFLYIGYQEEMIAVDPYGEAADYYTTPLPTATAILITHDHYDHYDPEALRAVATEQTVFVAPPKAAERLRADGFTHRIIVLANGDTTDYNDSIRIRALPAYNIVRERTPGVPFHPKGEGNGYLLTIDEKRIYIAGDTELIPEMRELNFIFIAFLPLLLPYTMSEEEFVEAAKIIEPEYLYPYHYETVDRERIQKQLAVVQVR